jgi:hypothetical protein
MTKKNHFLRNVATIVACLAASLVVFSGCDKDPDPTSDEWVTDVELAKFKLEGWGKPEGLSDIVWANQINTPDLYHTTVSFSGVTTATAKSINDYLTSHGYTYANGLPTESQDGHYHSVFERHEVEYVYVVNYTFDVPGGGGIQLMRQTKDSDSGNDGGGGGNGDITTGYTLTLNNFSGNVAALTVYNYAGMVSNSVELAPVAGSADIVATAANDGVVTSPVELRFLTASTTGTYLVVAGSADAMKCFAQVPFVNGDAVIDWNSPSFVIYQY